MSAIQRSTTHSSSWFLASIGALGIVFGDIGTSPLYTFKTVLDMTGTGDPATILGVLSLIVWTLVIITSVKYAGFAMRIDNDGEGGILALMALLGIKRQVRPLVVAFGLFGAALIYGDGAITPAISVLSALEGLNIVSPSLQAYVLPLTVAILLGLFLIQPFGTARIGHAFGPIMSVWFLSMALMGIWGVVQHPAVLWALNPLYGLSFLLHHGSIGFLVLGGVFLCVTGAEALYADMGHFGPMPIKLSWSLIVFPSLVLNYVGQSAIVLAGAPTDGNIFYRLCPPGLTLPLILLSTAATIIASQSIITGAFSMTRQAIALGWMPRLKVVQTSAGGYGQIYVGAVNWLLMIVTIGLALGFKKSDNLAAAYGIAVSATMLMTTTLLFMAMREIWRWSLLASGMVAGLFLVVDTAFFVSNLTKLLDGGYVPLILAALVYAIMYIWHRGVLAMTASMEENPISVGDFIASLPQRQIARVPGTAVFLTRSTANTPLLIQWYVNHSNSLHKKVLTITLRTESVPWVAEADRVVFSEEAPGFWRAVTRYGFMERPDIPGLVRQIESLKCPVDLDNINYFIGTQKIVRREDGRGLPYWQHATFAAMMRNSAHMIDFFRIPAGQLLDLGHEVAV
ncbi:KUP/HAK/KT family potassium transporter [Agrobacterium rhizogenes]|nr:KUP/HAK/KT family potassium transporter [Rhizobium rhizogenes]NTJ80851.1 KUP/HAK/KT family potassium transporter [Rhizobium rhizogenes]